MIKASQDIMKDKHKALRVLQAKIARATAGPLKKKLYPLMKKTRQKQMSAQSTSFKLELERNQFQVKQRRKAAWVSPSPEDQGGGPASSQKMASIKQWLGSLEATSLATYHQQEEHSLQASCKPHEPQL